MVVLAAGRGTRMQLSENKMFQKMKGVPIIYRTLSQINRMLSVNRIILVIRPEEQPLFEKMLKKYGPLEKKLVMVMGGEERYESVRKGLAYLRMKPEADIVMTHDGARPFITDQLIQKLINGLNSNHIAIPVTGVSETVRQVDDNGVTKIINRDTLYLTQTPQAFFTSDIEPCFLSRAQAKLKMTDEAGYFEAMGRSISLVEGDNRNIKITKPEDLAWAEFLLERYESLRLPDLDKA